MAKVQTFSKILVANRGEIAIRIFRACHDLGLHTVAIYSKEDMDSQFRIKADEAYLIGENDSPVGAYLDIPAIIDLAKRRGVDAIHPGYGFLSENAEFAKACEDAGIIFIGPSSKVLAQMGDKLSAKDIAIRAGVPIIPGTTEPLKDADEALEKAESFGFPVLLKAAAGGGGRGMRRCDTAEEVKPAFELVKAEAAKAFGNDDIFIEKFLVEPKHIEVQILADQHGHVYHLYERDCSLQRRYQKVIEYAPAWSVDESVLEKIRADAVKIAKEVGYVNAGTEEFLVDKNGDYYFIEMNPRIQVEHTVTEMVTGIDLVRAQLLVAKGESLDCPEIGLTCQEDVQKKCYAIQCRVTTEDPQNNFAPDHGKITAYRSSGGYGVRLDGGNAETGSVISPYYDSLLVKVTCFDNTFKGACRRALRAVSEVHVRGVKTNIPFISNILTHPTFLAGKCHTKFIDETPELFDVTGSRDRATRVLKYIAQIQVDNPDAERHQYDTPRFPKHTGDPKPGLKQQLDRMGPREFSKWVRNQKKLLITDTTMRDAHQSLLSTRMRTRDMVKGAPGTAEILRDCFSLEMWGGATFDVAFRFLHENPWERLWLLRGLIPNIPFQMLLRGSSTVGYGNYPDNVVREFIKQSAINGIDVFRVFDSLNWMPGMEVAIDEVLNQGKFCEGTICYTGDILDPSNTTFTLDYYIKMAKELEKRGVHSIAIKDMAGLLKPYAAKELVHALRNEVELPIHLHTHDTSGNQVATYLMAAEAGVDIVDCAVASMAGMTSQPSLNAVVAALQGQERDTGLDLDRIEELSNYYADVRLRYEKFDHGLKTTDTDIYKYEIPGGQYTNLRPQVNSLGLGSRFEEVKQMYKKVDVMLGGITKVTPSSKMVGDLAIFMVQNDLTPENIVEKGESLTFPDSVVTYFKGMMGQPPHGFPKDLQRVVLKGEKPITCRPGELLEPVDFDKAREEVKELCPHEFDMREIISYCIYPKVMKDYWKNEQEYGYLMRMGSHVFFNGLAVGERNLINIEDGKTLVIRYLGMGDAHPDEGTRTVIFELNGNRREVDVRDQSIVVEGRETVMTDPTDKSQSGASIPGLVTKINVKPGDKVKENDTLGTIEAMKMETAVVARMDGVIKEVRVKEGDNVKAGELLFVLE
ncbi:pyruvate carboxylase [Catenisphaera adipataccumulans]|jgi:pyruvate carboxylase|uniref:Pyruvate carboxylase n=1 Tax=Catenisphaera adipataccumulans TaxID=700500 RepID=A0A7W8CZZ6_9FIRM|nr:pyruvate carboxylase [Catenisphaera adipataccumulans]MBB5183573.1 pyruvate carboxylase [Catenisphaera adipataccumulans]